MDPAFRQRHRWPPLAGPSRRTLLASTECPLGFLRCLDHDHEAHCSLLDSVRAGCRALRGLANTSNETGRSRHELRESLNYWVQIRCRTAPGIGTTIGLNGRKRCKRVWIKTHRSASSPGSCLMSCHPRVGSAAKPRRHRDRTSVRQTTERSA